jgi:hypothetical protein
MKYTIEQKARLKGMDSFHQLKLEISRKYKIPLNKFWLKDDFIILQSKINKRQIKYKYDRL